MDLGAYVLNRLCVKPAYVAACVVRWRGETRRKRRASHHLIAILKPISNAVAPADIGRCPVVVDDQAAVQEDVGADLRVRSSAV
jgi:hypothetical protein